MHKSKESYCDVRRSGLDNYLHSSNTFIAFFDDVLINYRPSWILATRFRGNGLCIVPKHYSNVDTI